MEKKPMKKPAAKRSKAPAAADWPAARAAELWPLTKIIPYGKNPRIHPPEQVTALAKDMREDGVTMPILVDEQGVIIAGHGRLLAAKEAKFETYPVVIARGWSESKKQAARLKDNQRGLSSRWDSEILALELSALQADNVDLATLGFDQVEMDRLLAIGESLAADVSGEWKGMPEFAMEDKTAFRSIIVHFKDQEAVDKFAKAVKLKIGETARYLWFPKMEIERFADKRYAADEKK